MNKKETTTLGLKSLFTATSPDASNTPGDAQDLTCPRCGVPLLTAHSICPKCKQSGLAVPEILPAKTRGKPAFNSLQSVETTEQESATLSDLDTLMQPSSATKGVQFETPKSSPPDAPIGLTSAMAASKPETIQSTQKSTGENHTQEDWLTIALTFLGGFLMVFAVLSLIMADFGIQATARSLIVMSASLVLFGLRRILLRLP